MIVREFLTRLGFDADESKVRSFDGAVRSLAIGLGAAVGAMTTLTAAGFRLASSAAAYGDEVAKTARTLGLTAEALQGLRFAFDRVGVGQDELTNGLERLSRNLGQAARGEATARRGFDALGISIYDADGRLRQINELLPEIVDGLNSVEGDAQAAAIAADLFGRSGIRLGRALRQGSGELESLIEQFRLLGGGLTNEQAAAAEEFTDAMTNMRTVLNGLRLQIGAELMPVFQPLVEAFTDFMIMNRQFVLTNARVFFENLTEAMNRLVAAAQVVAGWIARVYDAVSNLSGLEKAALAVGLLFFGWQRLGKWFIAAGLIAILDDIAAWMAGQPSLIEKLLGPYQQFAEMVASVVESLGGLENVIRGVMALALAGWLLKVAGGAAALASALGLVRAAGVAGAATTGAGAATAAGAGAAAGAAARGAFLRGLIGRAGPIGMAIGAGLLADQVDQAVSAPGERQMRVQRQAETGEALQGFLPVAPGPDFLERLATEGVSGPATGITFAPVDPILDRMDEIRQYLDSLQGSSVDVDSGSVFGAVDNSVNPNIQVSVVQNVTVPAGTTAEQIAVIRREVDSGVNRAVERAAAALET
jgi:hypothetical protein